MQTMSPLMRLLLGIFLVLLLMAGMTTVWSPSVVVNREEVEEEDRGVCQVLPDPALLEGVSLFGASLCLDGSGTTTKGRFVVKRKIRQPLRRLSPHDDWNKRYQNEFGPDTLHVMFAGPEVFSSLAVYSREANTYTFPFEITLAGTYEVTLHHYCSNYSTIDEFQGLYERRAKIILKSKFEVLKGASWNLVESWLSKSACRGSDYETALTKGRWLYGLFTSGQIWVASCLPECSQFVNRNIFNGSWVRPTTEKPAVGLQWVPFNCSIRYFPSEEATECLSKIKITFMGDSHQRYNRNNLWEDVMKGVWTHRTHLTHKLMQFGSQKEIALDQGQQAVFFSFGHWPAAFTKLKGHWTLRMYTERLEEFAVMMKKLRAQHPNTLFFWETLTPFNPRDRIDDDWRSNHRLWMMEQEVSRVAAEAGFRRFPVWDVYYNMISTQDGQHFRHFQGGVANHIRLAILCRRPWDKEPLLNSSEPSLFHHHHRHQ